MFTILELRQKRAALVAQARQIVDAADALKRGLLPEENASYIAIMAEVDTLGADIERRERLEAIERDLGDPLTVPVRPDPGSNMPAQINFVSRGMREMNQNVQDWTNEPLWRQLFPTASAEYHRGFDGWMRRGQLNAGLMEARALQADADIYGGYLLTPLQFVDALIKAVDDSVFIRQWGTIFSVPNAESLGVPTLESDPADAAWTTELATGTEDSTMAFGRRQLTPHPLAKRIKISNKLLGKVPNAEALVRQRLAYKFAISWEKAGMTGTGSGQPLGVFTASDLGISTSRDVSTGNTATSIQFDGLVEAKYTLKGNYWPAAKWLFHRDALKQIAKLKDGEGQYIWRESVRVGEPDRILNIPAFMSEYAPNTFTASQYVGILGDFSNYWIADSMAMSLQRLVELYAESNQVGLIGRLESDGMPVLEEAFVRVKLSA